jgi:hypothetical protein
MPTLRLPHALSDSDRLVVSGDMSAALTKYEEVEAEKKQITSGYTKQLKELRTLMHSLNVSLTTGTIERETEVEDVEDLFAGKVRTIRKDTGECVKERALDPEERQMKLGDSIVEGGRAIDMAAERRKRDLTEEQLAALTPEEAEQMRADRLAAEAADAEPPKMPCAGDDVEVLPTGDTEWRRVNLRYATDHNLAVNIGGHELIYDVVNYGVSWRHPPTWSTVQEASEQAEIDRLAADQAADAAKDPPRKLLKAPKKKANGTPKRVTVTDEKDTVLARGGEEETATEPVVGCFEDCQEDHEHREPRVAF